MPKAPHFYLWIHGEAHPGSDSFEVHNPYNDACIATVSMAGRKEVDQAVQSAHKAARDIARMSRHERGSLLRSIAEALGEARAEMIDTLIVEGGKPRSFAEQEFERSLSVFLWAAEEARRFCGEQIPMDGMQRGEGYEGYTRREPIGPILGICPFNFPLNLVAHKLAPALAAGNPIIIKPASDTPISALLLARIVSEVGAPAGSLNVLPMPHREVARLLEGKDIRMLSFTGSPDVGWALKKQAVQQRVTLELGGNSGTIVDASADTDFAASRCVLGGFAQAGQSCIAVQRIYVQQGIYKGFLGKLIHETGKLGVGDPRGDDVVVGPMINKQAADRVMAWIRDAEKQGAKLACGGKRRRLGAGNVVEPTILTDVSEEMDVCRREVFGPVITVTPFEEIKSAVSWINHSEYGLQAAIFSNDMRHTQYAVDQLRVGGVVVNDFPTYRIDHMPYGGVKGSGLGREGIRSAMLEMTEEKMVVIRKG
ncbi:MAG: aldehyde dehydrogenase family protein [Mariprofundaceae bacterium]|nr:aldehyde dehydrogenase family protein [Mariprofundaceae bacterium]